MSADGGRGKQINHQICHLGEGGETPKYWVKMIAAILTGRRDSAGGSASRGSP